MKPSKLTKRKEPTLRRTKSLLNAALLVWELKNGLRPERFDHIEDAQCLNT